MEVQFVYLILFLRDTNTRQKKKEYCPTKKRTFGHHNCMPYSITHLRITTDNHMGFG